MLKQFGGIYANTKDDFEVLRASIEREGFTVAYTSEVSGSVIKEVASLTEDTEDAES